MKRFNLYEPSAELKIKLRIPNYLGEASFHKNANIAPGSIIPVILPSDHDIYLHSMRWGIHIFNNKKAVHNARAEGLTSSPAWSTLCTQRAVIVCKGFYLWNNTKIYDVNKRITYNDNQPFFISPERQTEGQFFYIAALYQKQFNGRSTTYSVAAISTSTKNDGKYQAYSERMPFFMRRQDLKRWFDPNTEINSFLSKGIIINTNEFMKVGLWVNCPEDHTEESIVLQSREKWDKEQNELQMSCLLDDGGDNLDFDAIEREALKQNEAEKNGQQYDKNWDEELSKKKKEKCEKKIGLEDEEKSANYEGNETKKRRFNDNDAFGMEDNEKGDEPPHKKRRRTSV